MLPRRFCSAFLHSQDPERTYEVHERKRAGCCSPPLINERGKDLQLLRYRPPWYNLIRIRLSNL